MHYNSYDLTGGLGSHFKSQMTINPTAKPPQPRHQKFICTDAYSVSFLLSTV